MAVNMLIRGNEIKHNSFIFGENCAYNANTKIITVKMPIKMIGMHVIGLEGWYNLHNSQNDFQTAGGATNV
jgi:hypothetical protein